jgi:hypothetical protein
MKRVAQIVLSSALLFVSISCQSTINESAPNDKESIETRVKSYEARARSYEALAKAQSLSPAYSSPQFRNHSRLSGQNLRMVYLQEANRYRNLADQAKKEAEAKKKTNE